MTVYQGMPVYYCLSRYACVLMFIKVCLCITVYQGMPVYDCLSRYACVLLFIKVCLCITVYQGMPVYYCILTLTARGSTLVIRI